MTKANHTPGPWGCEITSNDIWIGPMRHDGRKVADVVVNIDYHSSYTEDSLTLRRANARLIAAAPDLLEALEKAVADYGKPGGPWNVPGEPGTWIAMAREAIAKAKGE